MSPERYTFEHNAIGWLPSLQTSPLSNVTCMRKQMKETSNYAHFQKESTQGFSYITNITSSLLSWVCHELDLATSLDNGARSPNTHIWSNKNEILTISRALTSSTYVPLPLRKQPIMEFSVCVVSFYFVAFCEAQETCQKTEVCNPRVNPNCCATSPSKGFRYLI